MRSSLADGFFFFPTPNPDGKKKPVKSASVEEGRRMYVITGKNKNHTPLVRAPEI